MFSERLLDSAELADRLGLSIHTVRAWCSEGRLPLYRRGQGLPGGSGLKPWGPILRRFG